MSTDQKGNIAEAAVVLAAVRLGIDVYRPVGEGGRCDLIFGIGDGMLRVQCKWAPRDGDVVLVRCYSCRRNRDGLLKRTYKRGEIDAFAAYCSAVDRCYLLPFELFAGRSQISLRLCPTKNKQSSGINWASLFEFEATLGRPGAIAQLGERLPGRQEGTGSSPVGSIGSPRV
jgi:PD-(D/E)XK endonuclease